MRDEKEFEISNLRFQIREREYHESRAIQFSAKGALSKNLPHRRDTEDPKIAQRKAPEGRYPIARRFEPQRGVIQ